LYRSERGGVNYQKVNRRILAEGKCRFSNECMRGRSHVGRTIEVGLTFPGKLH
jgi:hypothetical protein